MPPTGDVLDFFRDGDNLRAVTEVQQDPRTIPTDLYWLPKVPVQPAEDHELRARWRGTAVIADLISLDAKSMVYKMLEVKPYSTEIPKIKFGAYLMESELREVMNLGQALFRASGEVPDFVRRLLATLARQLVTGMRWRLESMIVGAKLNGFHYDRMGILIDGDWGKATNLVVTPAIPWTDATNATPITDISVVIDTARITRATRLNRWVSSRAAFDAATATDEFKDRAAFFLPPSLTFDNLPVDSRDLRVDLFRRITRLDEVVFYDAHYRWEDENRARHLQRLLPINAVILEDTANDNNPDRLFLGNGLVLESAMIGRVGAREMGADGPGDVVAGARRGPFYYTSMDPELDPTSIRCRAVQHAWPIMPEPDSNAVLYVGDIQETVAIDDSF